MWLETKAVDDAVLKWKSRLAAMRESGVVDRHPTATRMILQWYEPLRDAIAAEQHQASTSLPALSICFQAGASVLNAGIMLHTMGSCTVELMK